MANINQMFKIENNTTNIISLIDLSLGKYFTVGVDEIFYIKNKSNPNCVKLTIIRDKNCCGSSCLCFFNEVLFKNYSKKNIIVLDPRNKNKIKINPDSEISLSDKISDNVCSPIRSIVISYVNFSDLEEESIDDISEISGISEISDFSESDDD